MLLHTVCCIPFCASFLLLCHCCILFLYPFLPNQNLQNHISFSLLSHGYTWYIEMMYCTAVLKRHRLEHDEKGNICCLHIVLKLHNSFCLAWEPMLFGFFLSCIGLRCIACGKWHMLYLYAVYNLKYTLWQRNYAYLVLKNRNEFVHISKLCIHLWNKIPPFFVNREKSRDLQKRVNWFQPFAFNDEH